jgi:signal transduction histidine kinase
LSLRHPICSITPQYVALCSMAGRSRSARWHNSARQASEERLAAALWGAQAVYWSTDLETDTSQISDNFFTITGIDRELWQADVEPWYTWVHRDDAPMGYARYRAHLAGGTDVFEHEYRIQTPRGWKWLLDRGKVIERDPAGRPLRMAGTTTDISARKVLERGLVDALNLEQRRVSRDLHEGVAQSLIGIGLLVASISRKCGIDRPDIKQDLDDVLTEIRIAAEETRSLVRGFLPASVERGDIGTALRELAAKLSGNDQISVACDTSGWGFQQMPADAAQHVFAMAQQALRNAIECARATTVNVVLRVDDCGRLVLVLSDNGLSGVSTGLESDEFNHKIMAYRAQALGGALVQERSPSGGTQFTLRCPIARPSETSGTYKTERGFCDCIPLHDRNIHLGRRKHVDSSTTPVARSP